MQASKEIIQEWESLTEYGDINEIAKKLGKSTLTTSRILKTGKGSVAQIGIIQKFFKGRKQEVAKISDDLN